SLPKIQAPAQHFRRLPNGKLPFHWAAAHPPIATHPKRPSPSDPPDHHSCPATSSSAALLQNGTTPALGDAAPSAENRTTSGDVGRLRYAENPGPRTASRTSRLSTSG